MAFSATTHPTLHDVASIQDPSGNLLKVVELLSQQNEMIMDLTVMESNQAKSHITAVRSGLPTGVWRGYNVGVPPSKATTATITEEIGNYETFAVVDRDLADLNGNSAEWRLRQEAPFMEHMTQMQQKQLVYGNRADDPNGFTGLSPRYNTVTATTAESADNVIDAGGTGSDNTSIWLCCWDPMCGYGIYPRGSQAGLQIQDGGEELLQNVTTAAGNTDGFMKAYVTHYKWQLGLVIEDWRYFVRIVNIDKSDLSADASSGAKLTDLMFQAVELLPTERGRVAFYMARDTRTKLFQQLANGVKSSTLTIENVGGVRTRMFQGIPVRRVDALSTVESRIT